MQDVISKWRDAALSDLRRILCQPLVEQTGVMPGIVEDDTTVMLFAWYSEVTKVTYQGEDIGFTVSYDQGNPDAKTYTRSITLDHELPIGAIVDVSGTYGLDSENLPAPLEQVLEAICRADEDMASGQSYITSKHIEDVSVSIQHPSDSALEVALTPYRSLISEWSLCPNAEAGGLLSYPTPIVEGLWFLNRQDYVGRGVSYGSAVL